MLTPSLSIQRVCWDVRASGTSGRTPSFSARRVRETVPRTRDTCDAEYETLLSLACGEVSREAPGAEDREAAWSNQLEELEATLKEIVRKQELQEQELQGQELPGHELQELGH